MVIDASCPLSREEIKYNKERYKSLPWDFKLNSLLQNNPEVSSYLYDGR
jgi:hypothetical protein